MVSFEPPKSVEIIGLHMDCASTDIRPKDSGLVEEEIITQDQADEILEVGAGNLNHLKYEKNFLPRR